MPSTRAGRRREHSQDPRDRVDRARLRRGIARQSLPRRRATTTPAPRSMPRGPAGCATTTRRRTTALDCPSPVSARRWPPAPRRVRPVDEGRPAARIESESDRLRSGGRRVRRRRTRSGDGSTSARPAVRRSLESSLERLGVDRVDIAYVHDPDAYVDEAITGAIPELIRMRDEGTVGAVGVGMNQWQAPLRMVEETDLDVVMLAGRWTLLDRSGQRCSTSARARAWRSSRPRRSTPDCSPSTSQPTDRISTTGRPRPTSSPGRGRLAEICRRHGMSLPAAALQFPLRHPAVASVVCGMRTAEQVASTLERFAAGIPESAGPSWTEIDP